MKLIRLTSMRAKMLIMFVTLTSIPLIVVGLLSYQKSYNTVSGHSKASTMLAASQLGRNIDVLFEDAGKLLELGKNPQVIRFLFSQTDTYDDAKEILNTFSLYRETYKYDSVLNITMVNLYGRGISERKGVFQMDRNPMRNPHFQELMNRPDEILNIPPTDSSPLDRLDGFDYPRQNVISIMTAVKNGITHEVIGYIVIDLVDTGLEQYRNNVIIGKTGFFYVTDRTGRPIFYPANKPDAFKMVNNLDLSANLAKAQASYVDSTSGKPKFIVFTTSSMTGWKIVGVVPLQEIMVEANSIRQLIIISVALSIIFAIALNFFITARLTRPVQLLKNKMRQAASGYFDAKVKPTGHDEIADLGISFNTMLEKINDLIDQHVKEQDHIQKAELRTLQAQIHPHFLYNTLDSIVWMAEAGKNDQVILLVQALSRFFRSSLNRGLDWIPLKEELEHARSYLVIQRVRYRDILDFEIEAPNFLDDCRILKMTLQPIVENALYHGIKNKRGKGLIRISCEEASNQELRIVVSDNGIGMSEERLAKLREQLSRHFIPEETTGSEVSGGFGLHNVAQRLRLYYGESYKIEVDSVDREGTTVTFRIPKQRR
ncbi:sensor histidine kinase [Cohnella yongneupensis]|uniref:Sensor histidine kinase n=1 Tax=Cohnella yongneupensis TaxID=425006 RepID=A0ABW0R1Y9_9BACL